MSLNNNPLNSSHPVTAIGGANIDIQGKSDDSLLMKDSNPGAIKSSLGGVGRNIADNISKFNVDIRLITAVGDDKEGVMVKDSARNLGINMDQSITSTEKRTSTYLYVLDEHGEMVVAVSDMGIVELLTPEYFKPLINKIDQSPYTIIDANLPQETIEYLAANLVNTNLVLDPVSITKAVKTKNVLDKFYAIKVNRTEAETLTGLTLNSQEMIIEAAHLLLSKGVSRVFITLGEEGVYYRDKESGFFRKAIKAKVVNATGSGDAFTAAMIYGFSENLSNEDLVDFCIAASTITLSDEKTIASDLTIYSVKKLITEQL